MTRQPEFHILLDYVDWRVLAGLAGSALLAVIVHFVVFALIRRASRRTRATGDDEMVRAVYPPSRWLAALAGWLAMRILAALKHIVEMQNDISAEDNLMARRRTTRVSILHRIGQMILLLLTLSVMLLAIPSVRAVGVTLMASAGLAALAVGAAAQPALKNLIAGVQMAFTEPIRLDDVVIVEEEWGRSRISALPMSPCAYGTIGSRCSRSSNIGRVQWNCVAC